MGLDLLLGNRKNISVFLILVALNIPLIYATWGHVWYSDDYQLFIAFGFKQMLYENFYVGFLGDLMEVRSDGHLHPVFNAINYILSLTDSANSIHVIKIFFHVIASYLVYLVGSRFGFNYVIASLASYLYTINYSIHIKILSWNVWGSLIVNIITGLIMLLFVIKYFNTKSLKLLIGIFLLSLLTIFNMETGFAFPIIVSALSVIYFLEKNIDAGQLISVVFVSIAPLIIYALIAFNQTSSFMPLLDQRVDSSFSESALLEYKNTETDKISYLRSRKAPRSFEAYGLRAVDLLLSSLNVSSIEYTAKSILNNLLSKSQYNSTKSSIYSYIYNNVKLLFLVAFVLMSSMIYFLIKNRSIFTVGKPSQYMLFIYAISLLMFVFIFHRRDISSLVIFSSSMIIATVVYNLFKKNKNLFAVILLTFYTIPSVLYYGTGFNEVYEMKSRVEQKKYSNIFDNEIVNYDIKDGKLIFHGDSDESAVVKKYKVDFYWHLVWSRRSEFLKDDFFISIRDKSFLTMLDEVRSRNVF